MYATAPEIAYRVFLVVGIAVGATWAVLLLRDDGVRLANTVNMLAVALFAALAGAKVFSGFERGGFAWHAPLWELSHGFRYPGGILGLVAVAPLLRWLAPPGLSLLRLADLLAPSSAFSMATVRLGCLLAGCCHGIPSGVAWALQFPRHSPPWQSHVERAWLASSSELSLAVHPLQLYFAAASLVTGLALLSYLNGPASIRRFQPAELRLGGSVAGASQVGDGATFFLFLLVDGLAKLALEQFRLEARPALQFAAAGFAAVGIVGLAVTRVCRHRPSSPPATTIRLPE